MNLVDLHVLVPNPRGGLDVCALVGLLDSFDEAADDPFENCSIDALDRTLCHEDLLAGIEKVRALNETGDARAYWGIS